MLNDLLADIHRSLDRLAEDLSRDRPDLASALRKEAALLPRPESPPASPARCEPANCAQLGPLLYRALDEGVVKPRHFDRLMIRRIRAARVVRARQSG
jgi:hypothetical protein